MKSRKHNPAAPIAKNTEASGPTGSPHQSASSVAEAALFGDINRLEQSISDSVNRGNLSIAEIAASFRKLAILCERNSRYFDLLAQKSAQAKPDHSGTGRERVKKDGQR